MASARALVPIAALLCLGRRASAGGTLKVSWKDCGGPSTHGSITGLTPETLTLGQNTTVTGAGKLDEGVTGGSFVIDMTAGPEKQHWTGDICAGKTFDVKVFGMSVVTVIWEGMKCPITKGDVAVATDIMMSSHIPSSFATATIKMSATTSSGDSLLCMEMDTSPSTSELVV